AMHDTTSINSFLRSLSPAEFVRFVQRIGGDHKSPDSLTEWANTDQAERIVCRRIKEVFGVAVPTTAELQESRSRLTVEATLRQATAAEQAVKVAEDANRIAHQANEIAAHANAKAKDANEIAARSLRTSRWNTWGTVIAAIVAVAAFLWGLFK